MAFLRALERVLLPSEETEPPPIRVRSPTVSLTLIDAEEAANPPVELIVAHRQGMLTELATVKEAHPTLPMKALEQRASSRAVVAAGGVAVAMLLFGGVLWVYVRWHGE